MSKEIREELRGWIRSATPGRWKALMGGGSIWVNLSTYVHREYKVADNIAPEDAKLIAATHNALPGLLDELDEKDAEIERLRVEIISVRTLWEAQISVLAKQVDRWMELYKAEADSRLEAQGERDRWLADRRRWIEIADSCKDKYRAMKARFTDVNSK